MSFGLITKSSTEHCIEIIRSFRANYLDLIRIIDATIHAWFSSILFVRGNNLYMQRAICNQNTFLFILFFCYFIVSKDYIVLCSYLYSNSSLVPIEIEQEIEWGERIRCNRNIHLCSCIWKCTVHRHHLHNSIERYKIRNNQQSMEQVIREDACQRKTFSYNHLKLKHDYSLFCLLKTSKAGKKIYDTQPFLDSGKNSHLVADLM